ncbi:hypothetical protein CEXT_178501 [Caerostris extrusa]|uniref:Uncharacterized protein n=1 Tax=Caerostris extrusa TaxID=172846 RepID=A0AAV4Y972_CAEEX|nr:hypothetical protein CEXT_178501 [Caerostris extrusa]
MEWASHSGLPYQEYTLWLHTFRFVPPTPCHNEAILKDLKGGKYAVIPMSISSDRYEKMRVLSYSYGRNGAESYHRGDLRYKLNRQDEGLQRKRQCPYNADHVGSLSIAEVSIGVWGKGYLAGVQNTSHLILCLSSNGRMNLTRDTQKKKFYFDRANSTPSSEGALPPEDLSVFLE